MNTGKNKKIKTKPARNESFEVTLERYGQGRLFSLDNLQKQIKKQKQ